MRVTVDGIEYEMTVAEPACGLWHYHDEPHPDGTPGQPQHHHHHDRCEQRTALLVPVAPTRPAWSPDQPEGGADIYRRSGPDGWRYTSPAEET